MSSDDHRPREEKKRQCYFFASTAHAHFQFLDESVFGLAPTALNRRVPLVRMPVCAVYTKHRRMCVHRDPAALMMHAVGPARSRR